MLEIMCGIGILVIGIAFLGMLGLVIYYFNKMLNHIMYLEGLNLNPIEELPDSINLDDLVNTK